MKKHFDERNILFSRLRLKENSTRYNEYYSKHPQIKESDKLLRENAKLVSKYINKDIMSFLSPKASWEEKLYETITLPNREIAYKEHDIYLNTKINKEILKNTTNDMTKTIKEKATLFGASIVRITKIEKDEYYKYKGITEFNDYYGKKTDTKYVYAIVIAIALNRDFMKKAPRYEEMVATEVGYDSSVITTAKLATYIKKLGYEAETSNYFNYLSPIVPIALKAGIGQLGKNYMVVSKEYGSAIKMAAVFTNLPLNIDKPVDFGLEEFCNSCMLCVQRCPTEALSDKQIELDDEKCMQMWQRARTDCGICISVCPFSRCQK